MSAFSIRNPHFIIVICLVLVVIGITSLVRMPVDLFPAINLPEVVVATFYSGMPPQDIETNINRRENFKPLREIFCFPPFAPWEQSATRRQEIQLWPRTQVR
ncbi:MAG TPA: efflux RND transporter permease subunit [Terriglobales bacterium]